MSWRATEEQKMKAPWWAHFAGGGYAELELFSSPLRLPPSWSLLHFSSRLVSCSFLWCISNFVFDDLHSKSLTSQFLGKDDWVSGWIFSSPSALHKFLVLLIRIYFCVDSMHVVWEPWWAQLLRRLSKLSRFDSKRNLTRPRMPLVVYVDILLLLYFWVILLHFIIVAHLFFFCRLGGTNVPFGMRTFGAIKYFHDVPSFRDYISCFDIEEWIVNVRLLLAQEGPKGLFRGLIPTLVGVIPSRYCHLLSICFLLLLMIVLLEDRFTFWFTELRKKR